MTAELDGLLVRAGMRGFVMHAFRDDRQHGPEVVAFVYSHRDVVDVIILHTEELATAFRTPTGPDIDVLNPDRVYWWFASSPVLTLRVLLDLIPPDHPGALPDLIDAPPDLGLPETGRKPATVRMRDRRDVRCNPAGA